VRQRQHAVRVCAILLWPFVPSSGGCGAPSVFVVVCVCVALATSIARRSPVAAARGADDCCWLVMLGLWGGEIDTQFHHQGSYRRRRDSGRLRSDGIDGGQTRLRKKDSTAPVSLSLADVQEPTEEPSLWLGVSRGLVNKPPAARPWPGTHRKKTATHSIHPAANQTRR
jgi:hypothetical protein